MATLNYATLKFPEILFKHIKLIQALPAFNVYRYTHKPGIIFRIPHGIKVDDVCHFFFEHEINFTNTLKTGTLTLKVQITLVPVEMGVFSGYDSLPGTYVTNHYDEDDNTWGYETFVPNYERGIKKIVPLPVGGKTNLYEYLNDVLFTQQNDVDIINDYLVNLGCQKEILKDKLVFVPVPEYSSKTDRLESKRVHKNTELLFDFLSNQNLNLLPEKTNQ
jgi:hypothetical protein